MEHKCSISTPLTIHKFTLIQLACFVVLWLLKASKLGILFPLMIAALVPIQIFMSKFFDRSHIETLIAEDEEEAANTHQFD